MKCIILAAGYATRLYPLTENFPKPLLKVGGKTILDYLIDDLCVSGLINEFIIVSNDRYYGNFCAYSAEKQKNSKINISVTNDGTKTNETRLGAVKDILLAAEKTGFKDDALVIAGDNLLDFSLNEFLFYAEKKNATSVMRYYESDKKRLVKSGVLEIGKDDRVLKMWEKPSEPVSEWCCPPFYFYKKEDLKKIPDAIKSGCGTDAPGSLISFMCLNSTVYAMEMPGKRYDIGDMESYEKVNKEYKNKC